MTEVSKAVFDRKCRDGEWQCDFEPNRFGTAQVRNARGRVMQVRVR